MAPDEGRRDSQDGQVMTDLATGNQVFHNGVPVQLLYRVALSMCEAIQPGAKVARADAQPG